MADGILALDLGTTALKAAPVTESGLCGRVTVVPYTLDYAEGRVTCDPERYVRCAWKALRGAARTAREQGLTVRALGLSSQAQTYIPMTESGQPSAPAVVWTDARAVAEAEAAALVLPDFAKTSGFCQPSPLQFLPKIRHFWKEGGRAHRFALLNEWILYRLTGQLYGDATNQGMGGCYDIARQTWNARALAWAGLTADNLAFVAPAASYSANLTTEACRALALPSVPVYSCGNDQSCAAVGAGIEAEGDIFCNFGTALVVYALAAQPVEPQTDAQIAGISPLSSRWFRLGVESECGNVIEWLAKLLTPRGGVSRMIEAALGMEATATLPEIKLTGGGQLDLLNVSVGCRREELARALLEYYAAQFGVLLEGVTNGQKPRRLFVGGGLSRSAPWLAFLQDRYGFPLTQTAGEHPGLVGIAKTIQRQSQR